MDRIHNTTGDYMKLNKKQKQGIFIFSIIVVGILLVSQLDLLAILSQSSNTITIPSSSDYDGSWTPNPPTDAYDGNWNTIAMLWDGTSNYKFGNIYETYYISYPSEEAQPDYLKFEVGYTISQPDGKVRYYLWNYGTSRWEQVSQYSGVSPGGTRIRENFQVSALDYMRNNEVKLRTQVLGSIVPAGIWESSVTLFYNVNVDCETGETKCDGVNGKEYFICENNKWKNEGGIVGKCNAECLEGDIRDYGCPDGTKVRECNCINYEWDCITSPEEKCQEEKECETAYDCEGKPHIAVPGEWECRSNKCVWVQKEPIPEPDPDEHKNLITIGVVIIGILLIIIFLLLISNKKNKAKVT